MKKDEIWNSVVSELKQQNVGGYLVEMLRTTARPVTIVDNTLEVEIANDFARKILEPKVFALIRDVLARFERPMQARMSVRGAQPRPVQQVLPGAEGETTTTINKQPKSHTARVDGVLNAKYTFDTFVEGQSNAFAYNACRAVARNPGKQYNPVFIYGGVGLGKTHLMQAIGQEVLRNNPKAKIAYLSSEAFTNEFINALRDKNPNEFRAKYRKKDVILIDDVQFFADKGAVVEEFFHTFNELHQNMRQIVMTSDSPPKKIHRLEERLVSRFEQGLVCDIQPPDVSLRTAILKAAADSHGIEVANEVLMYLAELVTNNVRELEGAFTKLVAYATLTGRPVNRDLVETVLKDIVREGGNDRLTIPWIQKKVAEFYDISEVEMRSDRRSQAIAVPRQVAMYLVRNLMNETYPRIGEAFGGKDHTTVIHAERKISQKLNLDESFKAQIDQLTRLIRPQSGG